MGDIKNTLDSLGVDWAKFGAQVLNFGLILLILWWFAYPRILALFELRRHRIEEAMNNADKIKAELAKTEAARLEVLNKANAQANQFIEEARAAAARVQEVETQKAIAAAEQIIAKAREASAADHARMLAELKREVGRLVVQTTGAVTGKVLTLEDQQRLAEETRKQLAA